MAQFNISGNYFGDKMIGNYNEYNFNWNELEGEVDILKGKTEADATLSPAVSELQAAVKSKKGQCIRQAVGRYAAEFSSATFANLASAGILALVKAFLP